MGKGICAAIANYDLCPAVTLDGTVDSALRAIAWTWRHARAYGGDPDRLTLSGHSAGAHLCAMALAHDWTAAGLPADVIKGAVPVSGIFDPEPAMHTTVNAEIGLTEEIARRNDALRLAPRVRCPVELFVGGDEPADWIRQSELYAEHLRQHGLAARADGRAGRTPLRHPRPLRRCRQPDRARDRRRGAWPRRGGRPEELTRALAPGRRSRRSTACQLRVRGRGLGGGDDLGSRAGRPGSRAWPASPSAMARSRSRTAMMKPSPKPSAMPGTGQNSSAPGCAGPTGIARKPLSAAGSLVLYRRTSVGSSEVNSTEPLVPCTAKPMSILWPPASQLVCNVPVPPPSNSTSMSVISSTSTGCGLAGAVGERAAREMGARGGAHGPDLADQIARHVDHVAADVGAAAAARDRLVQPPGDRHGRVEAVVVEEVAAVVDDLADAAGRDHLPGEGGRRPFAIDEADLVHAPARVPRPGTSRARPRACWTAASRTARACRGRARRC